jgi:hypothetical protein
MAFRRDSSTKRKEWGKEAIQNVIKKDIDYLKAAKLFSLKKDWNDQTYLGTLLGIESNFPP